MSYIRANVRLETTSQATDFVSKLNSDGTADKYVMEDFKGENRVNARSLLGVLYLISEHSEDMYLVNETTNGVFPNFINEYRG